MLHVANPTFGEDELRNVIECIQTGWISSQGSFVKQFEKEFAEYCGCKYAVACSSGTAALHLALLAVGVGPGDEVIVPSYTFIATANAVAYCRATPMIVDVDPDYWGISLGQVEAAITPKTKAIIPVHLNGHPCDMAQLSAIANSRHLYIIEDSAQALGAEYHGVKTGGLGHIGCFSFFANKHITTGEGGMCVTNDESLFRRMCIFRDHGRTDPKLFKHDVVGYNYRMTNLQAAVGIPQLRRVDEIIAVKRTLTEKYREALHFRTQMEMPWAKSSCWMYTCVVPEPDATKIAQALSQKGIETKPNYIPVHMQLPYANNAHLPVSESLMNGFYLPTHQGVTDDDIKLIASVCNHPNL